MQAQAGARSVQGVAHACTTQRAVVRAPFLTSHQPTKTQASRRSGAQGGLRVSAQSGMERVVTAAATGNGNGSASRLLIVGPGVLGSYLGKLWVDANGAGSAVGQTNTTTNHAKLEALGITPRTKEGAAAGGTFPYVVFSAPPSGSTDYLGEIKAAVDLWDGTGAFVLTSSAAVYAVEDGSACDESSPTAKLGDNERTDRLLAAEAAVLEAGGNVVRLVGLYHAQRGAHTFFLRQGEVQRWGGYTVNLIHYQDAASLCLAALQGQGSEGGAPYRGRTFLGCDGSPVTFDDMMAATLASGAFEGSCTFTGAEGPVKGKRMSNPATRAQLQWQPSYPSYDQFMRQTGAKDWYTEQQAAAVAGMPHA